MIQVKQFLTRFPRTRKLAKYLYARWRLWRGVCYTARIIESGPLKGYVLYAGQQVPYAHKFWDGSYEAGLMNSLKILVDPHAVVYDVGANIGYHTLLFAICATRGSVFAFEPLEETKQILERNLAANGIRNVFPIQRVVTASSGHVSIGRNIYNDQAAVAWSGGGNVTTLCQSVSLDDFIAEGNKPPTLVKIDVEGAERDVLAGAARCLTLQRPLIICETHGSESAAQVFDLLCGLGYSIFNAEKECRRVASKIEMPTRMEEGHVLACHPEGIQPPAGFWVKPNVRE